MIDLKDYAALLEHSYDLTRSVRSRLDYIAAHVFDFTTYDNAQAELFACKAVEVINAIDKSTTFNYIENPVNYTWYLLMCNMPFFTGRLNWGGSIRGAWWDHDLKSFTLKSCGFFDNEEEQILEQTFTHEEWLRFMQAVVAFAAPEMQVYHNHKTPDLGG
jgi:hypothetical protein